MKKLFLLPLTILAMVLPSQAAIDTFSGPGTGSTTLSYVVASAMYGKPRLQYINATSDKSTSVIKFYLAGPSLPVTIATNASQAVIFAPGTSFSASDVAIVRNISGDTYQRLVVSSSTATNITFSANLTTASAVGDLVYRVTANGTIPVGAATKELNAASHALYNGTSYKPLLFEIDGTSACAINAASGYFDR